MNCKTLTELVITALLCTSIGILALPAAAESPATDTTASEQAVTVKDSTSDCRKLDNGSPKKCTVPSSSTLPLTGEIGKTGTGSSARRPRIGLALGGGGTRGIAHLGVLKVLEDEGIHIDCIAGTSMGAIVGGLWAAGLSADDVRKICFSKSFVRSFDTIPIAARVALIPVFFIPHLVGYHPYDGLYRGNKFRNFLNNCVSLNEQQVDKLKIPFVAVASNLVDGKQFVIKEGNLGRAVQASSAVPQLRRPVFWNENALLVDGGLTCNVPVTECRALGADIVIAVDVDEALGHIKPDHFRKIGSVAYRALNMHLSQIDDPQIRDADIVIHPDVNGIELLSRKKKDMDDAVNEGTKATKEAIPSIRAEIDKKLCNTEATGKQL